MNYTGAQLTALFEEVERQGGALLPEPCTPNEIPYKIAGRKSPTHGAGCGHQAMLVVTYEAASDQIDRGGGFARVCAVDDNVGQWPRFRGAMDRA